MTGSSVAPGGPPAGDPPPARVALVTGASGGIGRAIAVALAGAGLSVAVHGRDRDRLAGTAAQARRAGASGQTTGTGGVRVHAVTADVTDFAAVAAAVADAEAALGPLDLLVNNAGVIEGEEVAVWEADPASWRAVLEADLLGPFHCIRAVVPGMVARGGGRVVDVNSGSGTKEMTRYSAYNVAKTGLLRLGGSLHEAGHRLGLRSFEVAPGVVRTPMTTAMPVHRDRTEWTDPSAVAGLVVAIAAGRLDAWSGRFLRAGADSADRLAGRAWRGLPLAARMLRLVPYGPDDPLVP